MYSIHRRRVITVAFGTTNFFKDGVVVDVPTALEIEVLVSGCLRRNGGNVVWEPVPVGLQDVS